MAITSFDARLGFFDAPTNAIVLDCVSILRIILSLLRKGGIAVVLVLDAAAANANGDVFHFIDRF
jgi:hypothetical protein